MAVDYNKPTIDQTRKAAIDQIRENFQGLAAVLGTGYLPLTGGTLTGNLVLTTAGQNPSVLGVVPVPGQVAALGIGALPRNLTAGGQPFHLDVQANGTARFVLQDLNSGAALKIAAASTGIFVDSGVFNADGSSQSTPPPSPPIVFRMFNTLGQNFEALRMMPDGTLTAVGNMKARVFLPNHVTTQAVANTVMDASQCQSYTIQMSDQPAVTLAVVNMALGQVVRLVIQGSHRPIAAISANGAHVWWTTKSAQVLPTDMGSGPLQCCIITLFNFIEGYTVASHAPF
jgi:hypothetical protein